MRWGLEGVLKRNRVGNALPLMVEGSKAYSKEVRAWRRTLKGNEGSKARSKGGEGSKARSKRRRGLKGALEKGGRVRKRITLDGKWKVGEKYRNFWGGLILMGSLPNNFNLGHFKVAFHLMDLDRNFSCEICKTYYSMSQSLDNMHASLAVLKYRSPFLLNLLVAWLVRSCSLIWAIFVAWLLAYFNWPM